MCKRGENIYMRKDGRWEGRYAKSTRPDGRKAYGYVYARTYREAKEKLLMQKRGQIANREDFFPISKPVPTDTDYVSFSIIMTDWLNSLRYQVKESTYMKYWNMMNTYILPELGKVPWNEMNRETIDSFCRKMLASGGQNGSGLSPKTVSDALSLIRNSFRYASDNGYPLPCDLSSVSVKQDMRELRVFSRKEQEQLCGYLYSHINPKTIGILISLFTGLRIGEICALKWEDISIVEKSIYVHQTMQRLQTPEGSAKKTRVVITTPKSGYSIRRIPIPDKLAEILLEFRRGRSGYVLTGQEDAYLEPRQLERYFRKILREASLEEVNFHVLRHTFATRCIEMDFDVKSLSEILGHANVNITMNRYVHPSMDLKRENMDRLSKLMAAG